ncbi:hypothetical protein PHMEG_0006166 [Phytophthora megakarya]|uniref:Uncharacterized protein n=1 Tax=Phytophthora megakarya TaxID=4795 RepID=A0A225WR90_9STRA|nr:hypothetical protein PHMEG_0006166 [Phytophthora megakarya]
MLRRPSLLSTARVLLNGSAFRRAWKRITYAFSADANSGSAAVIRNLDNVLPSVKAGVFCVVVTDRFWTLVQLALQLLSRNVYTVGTIQTNKKEFPRFHREEDATPCRCPSRFRHHCRRKVLSATSRNVVVESAARVFVVNRQQHQRRHLPGGQLTAISCLQRYATTIVGWVGLTSMTNCG